MAEVFKMIPKGYKAGKLYSEIPTSGAGDLTNSRGSVGTRVNGSGIVSEEAIDIPRLEYLETYKYRNLLDYSERVEGYYSNWAVGRIDPNESSIILNPINAETRKIGANSTSGSHYISYSFNDVELEDSTNYCWSFYIKAGTSSRVGISFKDKNNAFTTNVFEISTLSWIGSAGSVDRGFDVLDDGWIRLWQTDGSGTGVVIPSCAIYIYDTNGNLSHADDAMFFYYTGMQFERADEPTEYQPKLSGNTQISYEVVEECPCLLLEPQRINELIWSEDFGGAGYTATRCTVDEVNTVAPDGNVTGNKITSTDTLVASVRETITITAGDDYAYSVFMKKGTGSHMAFALFTADGSYVRFFVDMATMETDGAISEFGTQITLTEVKIKEYVDGWYRLILIVETNTTTTLEGYIYPETDGTSFTSVIGQYNYFWGWQLEEGLYETSIIRTNGSSVTRLEDLSTGGGNSTVFNSAEGVFYLEVKCFITVDAKRIICLKGSASSDILQISFDATGFIEATMKVTNVTQALIATSVLDLTHYHKIAFKYKENDFALWVDGVEIGTDVSGSVWSDGTLEEIRFNVNNKSDFWGRIREIKVYDEILTDEELETLTTL